VFAHDRIVLLEFYLARRIGLVLHRRIKMPGTSRRLELDLLALTLLGHDRLAPRRFRYGFTTLRKDANAPTILFANARPTRLVVGRVDEHHIRRVDVTLLLDDTASSGISTPGLEMPLLKANLLHPDQSIGSNIDDVTLLAAIGSCNNLNEIAFSNAFCHVNEPPARRYECVNRALQSTPSRGKNRVAGFAAR
jgi:hypothetical protein